MIRFSITLSRPLPDISCLGHCLRSTMMMMMVMVAMLLTWACHCLSESGQCVCVRPRRRWSFDQGRPCPAPTTTCMTSMQSGRVCKYVVKYAIKGTATFLLAGPRSITLVSFCISSFISTFIFNLISLSYTLLLKCFWREDSNREEYCLPSNKEGSRQWRLFAPKTIIDFSLFSDWRHLPTTSVSQIFVFPFVGTFGQSVLCLPF